MSQPKVIIVLGSGATVGGGFQVEYNGTLWEPPMDRNFFASPVVQSVFNKASYPALSWYQRKDSLEETVSAIDLCLKLCLGGVISEERAFRDREEDMNRQDESYRRKMTDEPYSFRLPSMAEWE